MTPLHLILLITAGIIAGLVGSLLGLGGGVLIVPFLVLLLEVPIHTAVATSLLCVIATSSTAASRNVQRGIANVRLAVTLEVWTVLGAMVGSAIAGMIGGRTLMIVFACAMALMAIPMARGVPDVEPEQDSEGEEEEPHDPSFVARLDGKYHDAAEGAEVEYRVSRLPLAMAISGVAGVSSGLLGVGGGIVKVPALTTFCSVPMKAAAATSNFMLGVTAATSAILYYGRGEVSPLVSAASVLGVFVGSRVGTSLASRMRGTMLRRAFAVVMIVVAAQLLWKALRGVV
ncbi:MAG TPA: sulfite exporter TauE/SafE family protein [Thermoanaerobaculia bacterium]